MMKDYFRSTAEIEFDLFNCPDISISEYVGNLRSQEGFKILKDGHICMRDCHETGILKKTGLSKLYFTKILRYQTETGRKQHLPLCLKCNSKSKVKALKTAIDHTQIVTKAFIREEIELCKHALVTESLYSIEKAEEAFKTSSNCEILIDNSKRHLSTSFDGRSHGLVFVNIAKKQNKGHCKLCNSNRCGHIRRWEQEMKFFGLNRENFENNEEEADVEIEDNIENNEEQSLKIKIP